jgi:hypothetical protein
MILFMFYSLFDEVGNEFAGSTTLRELGVTPTRGDGTSPLHVDELQPFDLQQLIQQLFGLLVGDWGIQLGFDSLNPFQQIWPVMQ